MDTNTAITIAVSSYFYRFSKNKYLCLWIASYFVLQSLAAQNHEPILGDILQDLTPNTIGQAGFSDPARGQIHGQIRGQINGEMQTYQILRLQLDSPQLYQAIEFQLEPYDSKAAQPVSLMLYGQAELNTQGKTIYQGTRLLTRGIAGKSLFRFDLAPQAEVSDNASANADSSLYRDAAEPERSYPKQSLLLAAKNFPIYIVLYPFQASTLDSPNNDPVYRYSVRFVKKDFGFVRFRLLPPQRVGKPNYLYDPNFYLKAQIDEHNYDWVFDHDYKEKEGPDTANLARFSQTYQLGLGRHNIQVSSQKFYARAQFQIEAGETQLVDLQLQERLSQLLLLVPKNAMLLLDGIPLQSKQRWTPAWQEVEVREQQSYHYESPRLEYRLTIPAGKHHLLVQYEGNTWQRELYFEEGSKLYFQLKWELSQQNVDKAKASDFK